MAESTVKRALRELDRLQRELDAHQRAGSEPAAIVGLGCRFPGRADGPEAYWALLREGRDAVTPVPPDRWALDGLPPELRWGAFLEEVGAFDAEFFGISPREAARMDPQQRLLLEVAWEALEDAGLPASRLAGGGVGVFVGAYASEYFWLQLQRPEGIDVHTATGNAHSLLANRLSYLLDLRGPSLTVDTACSSSLAALHLGLRSLRSRECDVAVVAGVSLMLSPTGSLVAGRALQLAPDGRCKAFDARADGIVRGEGCGAVVLKRLGDALADGDPVHALVRGTAMNQDGRTNGLTAPSPAAQRAVLRQALAASGVRPEQVGYVEAHGTGTPVGDPIEIDALAEVYGRPAASAPRCAVGSVKTVFGHLEAAAGIAGLIKAALALRHRLIPPHLHLTRLNPAIRLEGTRLHIPTGPRPWPSEGPRHAGVSAFSLGGTNVHAILEEAAPPAAAGARPGGREREWLLPLSARHPDALRRLAEGYQRLLSSPGAPPLEDVCFSASLRREHHPHRLAVLGRTPEELAGRLREALARGAPGSILGPEGGDGPERALAAGYVQGGAPDFRALYPAGGRAVPLPRYPWERRRHWLAPAAPAAPAAGGPLLRRRVRAALPTHEADLSLNAVPFLGEHRAGGQALLPGAAFLELALEAAAHHLGPGPCSLREVALVEALPLEADAPRSVQVTLLPGSGEEVPFRISSLREEGGEWTLHATGTLCALRAEELPEPAALDALRARLPRRCSAEEHGALVAAHGLELGATFRRVAEVHLGPGEALGRIQPLAPGAYRLHPAALDACLQVLWPVEAAPARHVLAGCRRLDFIPGGGEPRWSHARLGPEAPGGGRLAEVDVYGEDGRWVVRAEGLRFQPARRRGLYYGVAWRSRPRPPAGDTVPGDRARPWLVLEQDAGSGLGEALVGALEARGLPARRVPALEAGPAPAGVVYLAAGASQEGEVPEAARRGCRTVLDAIRRLARRQSPERIPLWLVTRGALPPLRSASAAPDPSQAPLWGLGRVLARELPELRGGLVELDPDLEPAQAAALLGDELAAPDGEDQLHLSAGERRVARLARVAPPPPGAPPLRADGGYLISGGLGGMGLEVARWMVERGAGQVVLCGRSGPSPAALEVLRGLGERGGRVEVARADVTRAGELAPLLARFGREWPPLRGLVHAAGTFEDGVLASLDWERFDRVLGPKLDGAWHLHQLAPRQGLDFFVLCGSSATLFGPPGLGNYVAANAFLDGLAEHRRRLGLPAVSIAWGPWAGTGMAKAVGRAREGQWHGRGLEQLDLAGALAGLEAAIQQPAARLGVMPVDWSRLPPEDRRSRFFDEVAPAREPEAAAPAAPPLIEQWRSGPPAGRRERVREHLREQVAHLLELPRAHPIDPRRSLLELGLDSMLMMELRNQLARSTGLRLPATLLLEHPTLEALSAHLVARLDGDQGVLERLALELERAQGEGA